MFGSSNGGHGPKFQIYKNKSNELWHWRLVAGNGEEVALSEPYSSKSAATKGTEALVRAANDADVVELEEPPKREARMA